MDTRFRIALNHAQYRLERERSQMILLSGDYNYDVSPDFWATSDGIVLPKFSFMNRELWRTSNTNQYAKFNKADFTFGTASSWNEVLVRGAGNKFIWARDISDTALTVNPVNVNQALYVNLWFSPADPDGGTYWEFGYEHGPHFRFYLNGKVRFYYNGDLISEDDFTPKGFKENEKDSANNKAKPGGAFDNQYVPLVFIPCKRNKILLINLVTGNSHTFEVPLVDTDVPIPEITPAEKVYIRMVSDGSDNPMALFQMAFAQLDSSDPLYLWTNPIWFDPVPEYNATGEFESDAIYENYYGMGYIITAQVYDENRVNIVPLSRASQPVCLKFTFQPAGQVSSHLTHYALYGMQVALEARYAQTPATSVVTLNAYEDYIDQEDQRWKTRMAVNNLQISVPNEIAGAKFTFTLYNPDALKTMGFLPQIASWRNAYLLLNRPCKLCFSDVALDNGNFAGNTIIDGRITDVAVHSNMNDEAVALDITVVDVEAFSSNNPTMDNRAFGGMPFENVLKTISYSLALPNRIESSTLVLPVTFDTSEGEFGPTIKQGETYLSFLNVLRDTFVPFDILVVKPDNRGSGWAVPTLVYTKLYNFM